MTIIDDDLDVNIPTHVIAEDLARADEDAPQIVAIIDERPPSMRVDEKTKNPLWQPIGTVEDPNPTEPKQSITSFKIVPKSSDKTFAFPDKSLPKRKKKKNEGDNTLPTKSRNDTPPREAREDGTPPRIVIKEEIIDDNSPPRRSKSDDISPPRKGRNDISPPRKRKDDISPPRKKRNDDISPPRKKRYSDMSPPRKRRDTDMSPPRKRKDNDVSPPRKRRDNDVSPPRRRRRENDISPPRRNRGFTMEKNSSESKNRENSPPVKKRQKNNDNSPPRKHKGEKLEEKSKKMDKTLDGKSAGLQNARELAEETKQFRSREDQMFQTLSKDISGENATTVHRDRKTGKIRNLEEEEERQQKKREEEEKNKEKYSRWGRGLVQVENRDQQIKEQLYEMSKPLARYADDEDLEKYLKEQEREGDPMLAYIRKKKKKKAADAGEVEKPQFEGFFAPNRYGIRPGHRWDGVDRSNGYEKKWFEVQNAKKAVLEDSYKWSTEDM